MSILSNNIMEIVLELRWSDQDAFGHVNNAKIMTLAEEARIRAFMQLQDRLNTKGLLDMVLRTTTTNFLRPVMYTGAVQVNVWISRVGTTSFVMQHELVQDGAVCATIEAVVVMFDLETQRPRPISAELRTVMEAVTAPPAR